MITTIELRIVSGRPGQPPRITASASHGALPGFGTLDIQQTIRGDSDAAMVARAMLQSAAYLFAQGQPVEFGPEIPREVLK